MRYLLLALLAGCLPELPDERLPSEPGHDFDGDGLTEDDGDCDDEDVSVGAQGTYWTDGDGDGWGAGQAVVTCAPSPDMVDRDGDCDDTADTVHPEADERCNGIDDDCDTTADEDAVDGVTFYEDFDGDGYGDDGVTVVACEAPKGYADVGGDCDDADADFHPGALESDCADPNDYNCDGSTGQDDGDGDGVIACEDCDDADDSVTVSSFYADVDGDGFGDATDVVTGCEAPDGYVADDADCDDGRDDVNPDATETCNGVDDDCDDLLDDGDTGVTGVVTWYLDADGDGHGDPAAFTDACAQPEGYVADTEADDCDDADATVYPGAVEACDATKDLNCDGAIGDVDGDGDGAVACSDCDDGNAAVYPGATETCNNVDDDCDGTKDEGVTTTYYADADADGYGNAASTRAACSEPSGYVADATDCDDTRTGVNPGATETCNAIDDDCDTVVDDGVKTTFYRDADADTYGSAADTTDACTVPSGYVVDATDCDDTSAIVNPGAAEICDTVDNDCDTLADDDDDDVTGTTTFYADGDDDGYGGSATTTTACVLPSGYAETDDDCNDADATIHPGATEACDATVDRNCDGLIGDVDNDGDGSPACADCDDTNGARYPGATETCNSVDDDCDGLVDDGVKLTFYRDKDVDTYGDPLVTTQACTAPVGYVANADDCNDNSASVKPGAAETCNLADDDCDGTVDEGVKNTYYVDADGDGYGSSSATTQACTVPSGYAVNSTDCDDTTSAIRPGATEICNGADDDCDTSIDEGVKTTWYRDSDADGFGTSSSTTSACTKPSGYVGNSTDCNDGVATIFPGAPEVCDGVDQDCDTSIDEGLTMRTYYADGDSDGYGITTSTTSTCATTAPTGYASAAGDCNDTVDTIHPGAPEACNSIDDDCDGTVDDDAGTTWYRDSDGDGYGHPTVTTKACTMPSGYAAAGTDCDDTSAAIHPGGTEICNAKDDDCDFAIDEGAGTPWYADGDKDGYGDDTVSIVQCTRPSGYTDVAGDCDDADPYVYPGEYCFSGGSHNLYADASAALYNPTTDPGDLGRAFAGIGDCDEDGYPDFVVSDPEVSYADANDGIVYVVTEKPSSPVLASSVASGAVYGNNADVYMGWAVAGLGAAEAKPTAFATGAPYAGTTSPERGRVFLMNCPITTAVTGTSAQARILGENAGDHAGYALVGQADVDADGVPDFAIGAPGYDGGTFDGGAVYVMSGASESGTSQITLDSSTALTMVVGTSDDGQLGYALGQADVNADGVADLVMGEPANTTDGILGGAVFVFEYGVTGEVADVDADYTLLGTNDKDAAGASLAHGDADGDGYDDLLVGAPGFDDGSLGDVGAVYLVVGGSVSYGTDYLESVATGLFSGEADGDQAGTSVALADLDGDRDDDVVIGAPYADVTGTTVKLDAGRVYIFRELSGWVTVKDADATWEANFAAEEAGARVGNLGDIDGDGWDDLGIGAPNTTTTYSPRLYLLYGKDL